MKVNDVLTSTWDGKLAMGKRSVPCVPILAYLAVPAKPKLSNFENKIAAIGPLLVYLVPNMRFHSKGTLPRPFIYIHIKLVIKTDNFIFPPVISQPPKKGA